MWSVVNNHWFRVLQFRGNDCACNFKSTSRHALGWFEITPFLYHYLLIYHLKHLPGLTAVEFCTRCEREPSKKVTRNQTIWQISIGKKLKSVNQTRKQNRQHASKRRERVQIAPRNLTSVCIAILIRTANAYLFDADWSYRKLIDSMLHFKSCALTVTLVVFYVLCQDREGCYYYSEYHWLISRKLKNVHIRSTHYVIMSPKVAFNLSFLSICLSGLHFPSIWLPIYNWWFLCSC